MNFASDNWAGAHPKIAEALGAAAQGFAPAYGASDVDREAIETISTLFEREVSVFFVGTGTAANALALSAFAKPGGVTFAHREAHVIEDECGAPEWFSGGGRLCPVEGPLGKMNPAALDAAIRRYPAAFVHGGQPAAITLTQATEAGTVHSLAEIAAISALARQHGLPLHMDGARFANSLVSLSCSPAEMTWKAGVDVLSFGGTKNGCWCAEAVIFFDPAKAADMPFLRKRGAQLFSKSRFIAAQFNAYLANGLWLETASHANAMAARLARAIDAASPAGDTRPRLLMSPRGKPLTQARVRDLAAGPGAVIVCGRFEGVDQRAIEARGLREVSMGDYILSGGEIAALALLDAVIRLLPGVMGNAESGGDESFESGLLEHPHYTRPAEWEGRAIPDVLISGNHKKIAEWRRQQALALTEDRRPDLMALLPQELPKKRRPKRDKPA